MDINEIEEDFYKGETPFAYEFLGCHKQDDGYVFRVWAPNAQSVSVVGDFNFWNISDLILEKNHKGVWQGFSKFAKNGQRYKFYVVGKNGIGKYKNDPYAFKFAALPDKSGIICDLKKYDFEDAEYKSQRKNILESPFNIYEVHLGSWKKDEKNKNLSYREYAERLIPYVKKAGYTHIELMPITEYPFENSWGYQVTGYFAPTSRYGDNDDFKYFVSLAHKNNIGVILDWVPAHFPKDEEGLANFDGGYLYEYSDELKREHPEWDTLIFDYSRYEVRSFLISSAVFWLKEYHIDGLRVDAVASMLYLDYGKKKYRKNADGSVINRDAEKFLKKLNEKAFAFDDKVIMCAEESTSFPNVTKPPYDNGLGFNFKWNMGWMNDTFDYMKTDCLFRKGKHNNLTFSFFYAFSENFILPFSHDETVHGKKSLIEKMPGSYSEKFDNLRLLYCFTFAHPGKKLSFMGNELAQFIEWNYRRELDWFLLDYPAHKAFFEFCSALNMFYLKTPELWEVDFGWQGFRWVVSDDKNQSVLAFLRFDKAGNMLLCIFNFTPVKREKYKMGLPKCRGLKCVFNSNSKEFGGKNCPLKKINVKREPCHGYNFSGEFILPPLSALYYKINI